MASPAACPSRSLLSHILAGTAATYRQIDPQTFEIVRRPPAQASRKSGVPDYLPHRRRPTSSSPAANGRRRCRTISAASRIVDTGTIRPGRLIHGSQALVEAVPILSSTHLGPGRNKLFIRGVADSSFNGPTQATVGQYLGEVRLNYNAPDPELALVDVASVEVLEGPQGALYGAGSLGGIVRLVPVAPDLSHASLDIAGGGALQAHGAPSGDVSAIVEPAARSATGSGCASSAMARSTAAISTIPRAG